MVEGVEVVVGLVGDEKFGVGVMGMVVVEVLTEVVVKLAEVW